MASFRSVPVGAQGRHVSTGTSDDDFDDLPETHLDDEEYEEFLKREMDPGGRLREGPPVGWILLVLTVIVLGLAFVLL